MFRNIQTLSIPALCLLPVLILTGCVESTSVKQAEVKRPALFYPALPNPPRIQYLYSFSSDRDLKGTQVSGLGEFLLGQETQRDVQAVNKPYGVAMYGGKIYVTDTRGNGYVVFDLEKKSYRAVRGSGPGAMPKAINITIDTDGTKYITDTVKNQVLIYDAQERFVEAYGAAGQFQPGDVVIAGDRLYVSDLEHHSIHVLDKNTGAGIATFGKAGSAPGELFFPTNLALGSDNHLYISDTGNTRVQEFTLDGEYVRSVGQIGLTLGSMVRPKGIDLDAGNNLYVVDAAFENIQIFNPEGKLLLFFGEPASNAPGGLDMPTDISISYEGVPYLQEYADPGFQVEYLILVANQFGRNKVTVYGYGQMEGMSYQVEE